jgi:hypothetical protein
MKSLKTVAIMAASLAAPGWADQPTPAPTPSCPSFAVATNAASKHIFLDVTPAIDGAVYNWTTSAGTFSGNGRSDADLDIEGLQTGSTVEVTIDITELGPTCPQGVSLVGTVKVP